MKEDSGANFSFNFSRFLQGVFWAGHVVDPPVAPPHQRVPGVRFSLGIPAVKNKFVRQRVATLSPDFTRKKSLTGSPR